VRVDSVTNKVIAKVYQGRQGEAGTNGTNGGSTSAWQYNAKTNATSGYPGNGYLLWNNATQTSATSILVSHLTDDNTDIELFLSFFVVNQKIFIQDRDDSSKNQVWLISGTPTVTGANTSTAYYTFPVTLVSSAGGAFTNNHSILFGQISVATNAVTSATTSDGTCALSVASLGSLGLVEGATGFQFGDVETAAGMVAFNFDNTRLSWESELPTQRSYGFNVLNLAQDVFLYIPNATGTLALTSSTTGVPDKLTNGTIAGTLTINSTTITYGTGAAAAHRTALGLTTLATTTAGTGVVTALGNNANGAGGFVTDSGTVANATNADYATIAGNATTANEVPLNGITGLGTSVATALAINIGSSGAMVTSNSTDTLTNKTLTSPAINSATLGTAATFNATSYTYGAGAAAAHRTALGLVSNADTLTSVYEWTKATGDYTATNVGTGTSSTATNVMQLNTLATAGSSALLRSDANDFRAWQKYTGTRQAVDWSKKTMHYVRISSDVFTGADTIFRIYLGLPSTLTTVQDLQSANTAIGFKVIAGEIFVQVSNGSAVTTTTTGVTMSAWLVYDCIIQSNGNGTWTATVNSTTVTGSGAPSATSAASNSALVMSATNGTTAATRRFFVNNQKSMQYD
jgi:hypothetical protein